MHQSLNIPTNLPADLKYSNRFRVIEEFLGGEAYSAKEISEKIGLSRQTVMKCIQFFQQKNLLESAGKGASTDSGGKRPEMFVLVRNKYSLSITLWPNEFCLHLFTLAKEPVDSLILNMPLHSDPKTAINNAGRLAREFLAKNKINVENLYAVSLSTSGIVDYKKGTLKYSSQSPEWGTDIPLLDYLRPYFAEETLLFMENAGKMTARPLLLDLSMEDKRVLTIFSSWGFSSCMIEKGTILNGRHSLIGEIGHMILDPTDPEKCGCGGNGCLERLVSIERLRRRLTEWSGKYPHSQLAKEAESATISSIFRASAQADPLARELVKYLAGVFSTALRNIALVFDPEIVVFQGDFAYADEYFDQELRNCLNQFRYFSENSLFEIQYDQRPLEELDALGSCIALSQQYFGMLELYENV